MIEFLKCRDKIFVKSSPLPCDIPSGKKILLIDGEYTESLINRSCEEEWSVGPYGKIASFTKIFPHKCSTEEIELLQEKDSELVELNKKAIFGKCYDEEAFRKEKDRIENKYYKLLLAAHSRISIYYHEIEFFEDKEMSMECFNAILEYSGNPDYIIVTNDFVYEHLPSEGKPKDIPTSEGIVEAWEINGITMFYMPLTGNMSEEDILLWRKVLTEVLV